MPNGQPRRYGTGGWGYGLIVLIIIIIIAAWGWGWGGGWWGGWWWPNRNQTTHVAPASNNAGTHAGAGNGQSTNGQTTAARAGGTTAH